MDPRRMSNWNVLSVEAALQQLNNLDEDKKEIIRRPNTVNYPDKEISVILLDLPEVLVIILLQLRHTFL
ncbi:hypothetical protein ANTQUA_LOCUS4661 [Anthophora quadrimaculata]